MRRAAYFAHYVAGHGLRDVVPGTWEAVAANTLAGPATRPPGHPATTRVAGPATRAPPPTPRRPGHPRHSPPNLHLSMRRGLRVRGLPQPGFESIDATQILGGEHHVARGEVFSEPLAMN